LAANICVGEQKGECDGMSRYILGGETLRNREQKRVSKAFFAFAVNILLRFARVRELFFVPLRPFSIDWKFEIEKCSL